MSKFYLLSDINFNNTYEGVVDFDNISLQSSYFNSRKILGYDDNSAYIRGERQSIKVNIPKIVVEQYSYFMFTNMTPDNIEKTYYAFIQSTDYIDQDTTRVYFEIDYWQTYLFDVSIKDCFIDRQHEDRFIGNAPNWNLEVENIDIGDEYKIDSFERIKDRNSIFPNEDIEVVWIEVVATEKLSTTIDDKAIKIGQIEMPYYVYYIPFIRSTIHSIWMGDIFKFMTPEQYKNNVANNGKVVSVRFEPYPPFVYTVVDGGNKITLSSNDTNISVSGMTVGDEYGGFMYNLSNYSNTGYLQLINKYLTYTKPTSKELNRNISHEIKLLQHPFTYYAITNFQHESLVIKPQYLPALNNIDLRYVKGLGFTTKSKIFALNYNNDLRGKVNNSVNQSIDELPLVTDYYKNYMASHKASATSGLAINTLLGVGGLALGLGPVMQGSTMTGLNYMEMGVGINSMKGVYNELVKQQDLRDKPNTERTAGNNAVFDLCDNNIYYNIIRYKIQDKHMNKIYNYLYRYGYKANKFGEPNLRSRYYFNYIKCTYANVVGDVNTTIRDMFIKILTNGTTIWHCRIDNDNPAIYNYTKENIEMTLLEV